MDDLWVVVPVRGFAQGKSRLAATLTPAQREWLNRELLARTLAAVAEACAGAERCIVVSPDPRARSHALAAGAAVLDQPAAHAAAGQPEPATHADPGRPESALNAALAAGARSAARRGASRVLLLAADLPGISGSALSRWVAATGTGWASIAADRHGHGTNALLLPAGSEAGLRFGTDSLHAHRAALESMGMRVSEWRDPALAFDLDTPEDWAHARATALLPGP